MKVALSIKGGAARGLASFGLIKFLKEKELTPKIVAGSSAGAFVALCYSLNIKFEDILEIISSLNIYKLISFKSLLSLESLVSRKKAEKFLYKFIDKELKLEELSIKTIFFATDPFTKERILIHRGNVIRALIVSCSYPLLMPTPVRFQNEYLIDGDLTNSYSTNDLKKAGADKVLGTGYLMKTSIRRSMHFNESIINMYSLLTGQTERLNNTIDPCDFEFKYKIKQLGYFNLKNLAKNVDYVYHQAKSNQKEITSLFEQ